MFRHFLTKPNVTGAVCASSPALARMITANMRLSDASAVAEIGPGTGAFTGEILRQISKECRFFTVEINDDIVNEFCKCFPNVKIYNESAGNLSDIIKRENVVKLDAIISGLPWACFPPPLQDELLTAITESLADDGVFSTFSYLKPPMPKDLRFRKKLYTYFTKIVRTPIVWRNMPPAFVYRCEK